MEHDPMPAPRPRPTPVSEPYWTALGEDRLLMQRCSACDHWVFYPRNRCTTCLSADLTWHDVEPVGSVYAVAVARQPTAPPFAGEIPQLIAVVELTNGVRVTTTLVDVDASDVSTGMAVTARFDHGPDGGTLLRFGPADY